MQTPWVEFLTLPHSPCMTFAGCLCLGFFSTKWESCFCAVQRLCQVKALTSEPDNAQQEGANKLDVCQGEVGGYKNLG